jgi:hypothetical protein
VESRFTGHCLEISPLEMESPKNKGAFGMIFLFGPTVAIAQQVIHQSSIQLSVNLLLSPPVKLVKRLVLEDPLIC